MLDRREMDLSVTNGEVDLVVRDTGSRSHVLVRELMILYNELGAQTAHAAGLEFVYRTQGAPAEPWPENVSRDPAAADRLFRGMKPSRSAAEPGLHASLGVEAYTQLTSPLRRYSDLVLQRQLVAHLGTDRAPYDRAALDRVFARMDELSRSRARLERESRRHWAIEYLVRHARHAEFDAIVVREDGDGYLTELVDTTVRGALIADDVQPGDRLAVKITEAKPRSGRLRFAKV